jgi:hypothetical protein
MQNSRKLSLVPIELDLQFFTVCGKERARGENRTETQNDIETIQSASTIKSTAAKKCVVNQFNRNSLFRFLFSCYFDRNRIYLYKLDCEDF